MRMKFNWSRVKYVLAALFLLVLVLILVIDIWRRGVFDSKRGMNLAVVGDGGVSILALRPDDEILSYFDLPLDVKVKISGSEAEYRLGSLWKFTKQSRGGAELYRRSLAETLAIPLAKIIYVGNKEAGVEGALEKILSFNGTGDLSLRDRFLIRSYLAESLKSKSILQLQLSRSVFDEVIEADGKSFLIPGQATYLWMKSKLPFNSVLSEAKQIKVFNYSEKTGRGHVYARMLDSLGVRVLEVSAEKKTFPSLKEGCVFNFDGPESLASRYIETHLGCKRDRKMPISNDDGGTIYLVLL